MTKTIFFSHVKKRSQTGTDRGLCLHSTENSSLGCQDLLGKPGRSKLRPPRFPAPTDGHGTTGLAASWPEMFEVPGRRLHQADFLTHRLEKI